MNNDTGYCKKCCRGGSGQIKGQKCQTPGCEAIVGEWDKHSDYWDPLPNSAHRCPRRDDLFSASHMFPGDDHWEKHKTLPDRTCSYCGSLHFDDFKELVALCIKSNGKDCLIEPSDKSYKVYVSRPGIRNSSEGATKFYMHHVNVKEIEARDPQEMHVLNFAYSWAVGISNRVHRMRLAGVDPFAGKV